MYLKRQMATAMKTTLQTTVEISGSHENTGSPLINEIARDFICPLRLKASINGEI